MQSINRNIQSNIISGNVTDSIVNMTINVNEEQDVLSKPLEFNLPINEIEIIGRDEESKEIDEKINSISEFRRVAITGFGGIGKTSLSIYCVKKWLEKNFVKHCFLLHCQTDETFKNSIDNLAEKLRIKMSTNNLLETFKEICGKLSDYKCAFIYDNVDDYNVIKRYLPDKKNKNFFTLLTSQKRDLSDTFIRIDLKKLSTELGKELFLNKLKIYKNEIGINVINSLVKILDGYPLGLTQAAAFIIQEIQNPSNAFTKYTINQIIQNYIEQINEKIKNQPSQFEDDYPNSINQAILINYYKILQHIKKISNDQNISEEIIKILAYCDPDNIDKHIFNNIQERNITPDDIEKILTIFINYSFINWIQYETKSFIEIHRTVQHVIRMEMKNNKVITNLCNVLQLLGSNHYKKHYKFLVSYIKRETILECNENEWKNNCEALFRTPCIKDFIQKIINILTEDEDITQKQRLRYIEIFCKTLIQNGNLLVYEQINENESIFKIFQNVLNSSYQLSVWEKKLTEFDRKLLFTNNSKKYIKPEFWIDVHWLTWWERYSELRQYQTRLLTPDWNGWTVIHIGAMTGDKRLLKLFTKEQIRESINAKLKYLQIPPTHVAQMCRNTDYFIYLISTEEDNMDEFGVVIEDD